MIEVGKNERCGRRANNTRKSSNSGRSKSGCSGNIRVIRAIDQEIRAASEGDKFPARGQRVCDCNRPKTARQIRFDVRKIQGGGVNVQPEDSFAVTIMETFRGCRGSVVGINRSFMIIGNFCSFQKFFSKHVVKEWYRGTCTVFVGCPLEQGSVIGY